MSEELEPRIIKKTICIDEESHDVGLRMAAAEKRSFSNFIAVLLHETAVKRGYLPASPPPTSGPPPASPAAPAAGEKMVPLSLVPALVEEEITVRAVAQVAEEAWTAVKQLRAQS